MAEMDFQRRQRSPWIWIVGLVILAGFVWILLSYVYMPEDDESLAAGVDSTYAHRTYEIPADTVNEVREFIDYVRNTTQNTAPKRYTEKGLIKLQSALSYVADHTDSEKTNVEKNIDSLDRTMAQIDTSAPDYLRYVKTALSIAANAIESIRNSPDTAQTDGDADLRRIESGINSSRSLQSQLHKIKEFFTEAGNVLQNVKLS